MRFSSTIVSLSFFAAFVHGHGCITEVKGANGNAGAAFGIDEATPRDGSRARPFQQDTSIIRDFEIRRGRASACGRTKLNGVNDIASNLQAASAKGLPSTTADGEVQMTLHQVNQDGAGPFKCEVNTDGTGENFVAMQVTTQVPGFAGLSRAKAQDFPLVAKMPAGTQCTGGPDGNACIVRCRNPALAGPFGGCVAVTMGDGAAAGNATDTGAGGGAAANDAGAADAGADAGADTGANNADAGADAGANNAEANPADDAEAEAAANKAEANEAATDGKKGLGAGGLKDILGAFGAGGGAGAGGLGGILGGGARGGAGNGAGGLGGLLGGQGGGLGSILGGFGRGNANNNKRRMVKSRIVSRNLAGRWI